METCETRLITSVSGCVTVTFHRLCVKVHSFHALRKRFATLQRERVGCGGAAWRPVCLMAETLYADRACSVCHGMDVKWTAVEVYKKSSMRREITVRESQARECTLPYWVAALIQQQTDPEKDHLSPLWSPYKSSTFPLFSSAARKLIKLAFPCCFWQKE